MRELKLEPELVPRTAWCQNLRSKMPRNEWTALSKFVRNRADNLCQVCGGAGAPGVKHMTECHETWDYSEPGIQKLVGLVSLCPPCHEVKHIGLAQIKGLYGRALAHMAKVNGVSKKVAGEAVNQAFLDWCDRGQRSWECDISLLDEIKKEIGI